MGLLLLEALLALALLLFIVWWTMFSGRRRGERADVPTEVSAAPSVASTDPSADPVAASGRPASGSGSATATPGADREGVGRRPQE
jgi:hypothetical protein